jgi:hypothetical protein
MVRDDRPDPANIRVSRPLPAISRRWMTVALLALLVVAIVVALSR